MKKAYDFNGGDVDGLGNKLTREMEYVKAEILKQRMYRRYRDILSEILEDGVTYAIQVVDRLLMDYLKNKAGIKI